MNSFYVQKNLKGLRNHMELGKRNITAILTYFVYEKYSTLSQDIFAAHLYKLFDTKNS